MVIRTFFFYATFATFICSAGGQIGGCHRVLCYFTSWAQYRPRPMTFIPENIDVNLCTHLVYAFATLNGNRLAGLEWNDEPTRWGAGMFARINRMKRKNPALKSLLAVGGWHMYSPPFSAMASTAYNRGVFINSTIEFLRQRSFDGIDFHWEYPTLRGGAPNDISRFTNLVQELQDAFRAESIQTDREKMLVTVAVAPGKKVIDAAYEVKELERDVDFFNIKTFDFHGSWDTEVGHNSPLYADDNLSISWAANYYLSFGVPAKKLTIGLATYGRHVYLTKGKDHAIGTGVERPGNPGIYTKDEGTLAYFEVCKIVHNGGSIVREPRQHVPYFCKDRLWVGYDDAESLQHKVRYIKQEKFGGIMIWTLDFDDFNGTQCDEGKYPLVKAIIAECKKF